MKNIIVFDFDGTISNSSESTWKMFKKLREKYNLDNVKTKKQYLSLFKNNFFISIIELGIAPWNIPSFIKDIKKELELAEHKSKLFKEMPKLIKKLSKKNIIYIVTSNITSIVKKSLRENKINVVKNVFGSDVSESKVKKLLMIKTRHPKDKIIYIGDTGGDIKEGKSADILTIAVSWGYSSYNQLKKEKPFAIAKNPKQLDKIISELVKTNL